MEEKEKQAKTIRETVRLSARLVLTLVPILLLAVFLSLSEYKKEQIWDSITKGYCYAEDENFRDTYRKLEKVLYHGTLEKLKTHDRKMLDDFVISERWELNRQEEADDFSGEIYRVECKDFVISHCNVHNKGRWSWYYMDEYEIPENTTYYGDADVNSASYLVFNKKTGEVLGFLNMRELYEWLEIPLYT